MSTTAKFLRVRAAYAVLAEQIVDIGNDTTDAGQFLSSRTFTVADTLTGITDGAPAGHRAVARYDLH